MLNFKELPSDGQGFELLVRELLFRQGFRVYWSGKGADGGRDLICEETRDSLFLPDKRIWLLQCKHNAHSGKSVGIGELDDIVDSCNHHGANGYVLACSTHPSSTVVERLERITSNKSNQLSATYWDSVTLERMLSEPSLWSVAQKFFPESASGWQIYATERPNHWVANFKGYYFHISRRIGSKVKSLLNIIETQIESLEKVKLQNDHFIRLRSVYYNDKGGAFTWYVDYMRPYDYEQIYNINQLREILGEGGVCEYGQMNFYDIKYRKYSKYSEHYDQDHYDYYDDYVGSFALGYRRT